MSAPKGNKFWTARAKSGRDKTFKTPENLWQSCCEYFEWADSNPLWESKPFAYQGVVIQEPVAKMRAMTISGLCLFLDIDLETWRRYRARDDFRGIVNRAEQVIWDQKFAGASADLLNANIIARELGLSDKQENKTTISFDDISDEELDAKIRSHLDK